MAWEIDPFAAPLSATSSLYTLPGMPSTGYEIRINGINFTYDAATGFLNGGTIFSMSLVSTLSGFTQTVQTATTPSTAAAKSIAPIIATPIRETSASASPSILPSSDRRTPAARASTR